MRDSLVGLVCIFSSSNLRRDSRSFVDEYATVFCDKINGFLHKLLTSDIFNALVTNSFAT